MTEIMQWQMQQQNQNHMLLFMTFRLNFRENFTTSVVWHFALEEPGSLSLQVSKMHMNKVMTDTVFMRVLLQGQG